MNTLSISTQQQPLIPLPPTRLAVSGATAQTMRMMLDAGTPPAVIASLLAAAGLAEALTLYLRAPLILPDSPWADSLPDWLPPAVYGDRLASILAEYGSGIVGSLATPAEVLAYLYPLTLDAPLPEDLRRIYLYAGREVLPRHNRMSRTDFLARMTGGQPLELTVHEYRRLRRLQYDLRRRAVRAARNALPQPPALPAPDLFPPSLEVPV